MSAVFYDFGFADSEDEQDFRDYFEANGLGRGAYAQSADFFVGYLKTKPDEDGWKLLLARNAGQIEGYATVSTVGGKPLLGQHLSAVDKTCANALFDWIEQEGPVKWI